MGNFATSGRNKMINGKIPYCESFLQLSQYEIDVLINLHLTQNHLLSRIQTLPDDPNDQPILPKSYLFTAFLRKAPMGL